MAIRERPEESFVRRYQGPISFCLLLLGAAGIVLAYILVTLGVTLFFDLHGYGEDITAIDSAIVVVTGLVFGAIGYGGYRAFLRYAY